jgi:HlyD family secretion protein
MNALMSRSRRGQRVPIWIYDATDKSIRPMVVKLGLSDGVYTEMADGKLKEGDKVITGVEVETTRATPAPGSRPPGFGGMGGGRGGFGR